jgi:hypothetical protein
MLNGQVHILGSSCGWMPLLLTCRDMGRSQPHLAWCHRFLQEEEVQRALPAAEQLQTLKVEVDLLYWQGDLCVVIPLVLLLKLGP